MATIGTMGVARYYSVDRHGGVLTDSEVAEGWHFCPEWDEMLVGPGMPELESCSCVRNPTNE